MFDLEKVVSVVVKLKKIFLFIFINKNLYFEIKK